MATRSKKPKCDGSTSQSCGMGCISREDTCRELVSATVASRLLHVATVHMQDSDSPGSDFDVESNNFPLSVLKAAHKTGVATLDLGNGATLTTKEAVGLDGSTIKYGFVTDAGGARYTISDGRVKEVTSAIGSEWQEAFDAAVRSKIALPVPDEGLALAKLPDSVTYSHKSYDDPGDAGDDEYRFSVSGREVLLSIDNFQEVGFSVDDKTFSDDTNKLSRQDSALAAIKLAAIMKHDASKRPDGYQYYASATTEQDNNGYKRAAAYERLGFSRPVNASVGRGQFAIVYNGKAIPDLGRLAEMDTDSKSDIDNRIKQNKSARTKAKLTQL